jgi:peptidoglycan/LPS O-acetylase OafA/YrhL
MWSLAIEEQFYLIAPTLILLSGPRKLMFALILIVLTSPFLRSANLGFSAWDFTFYRLDGFSAGILAAILIRDESFTAYALENKWKIDLFALLFVMATLLLSMVPEMLSHQRLVYGISLNSIATAGIIVSLNFGRNSRLCKTLSWRPLVALGRGSYFLYLMHIPVLLSVKASNVPRSLQPSAALLICLVGAWASWRYLESPLINVGKRHNYVK